MRLVTLPAVCRGAGGGLCCLLKIKICLLQVKIHVYCNFHFTQVVCFIYGVSEMHPFLKKFLFQILNLRLKKAKLQYFSLTPCCQIYRVTEED